MRTTARAPGGRPPAGFVPYIHGATQGRPSRGRPEKVLAHFNATTTAGQEDGLAREVRGAVPGGSRNGRPEPRDYVYRGVGEDTLTGSLSGKRLKREADAAVPVPAVPLPKPARRAAAVRLVPELPPLPEPAPAPEPLPEPEPATAAAPTPAKRCRACGYLTGTIGHRIACGDAS